MLCSKPHCQFQQVESLTYKIRTGLGHDTRKYLAGNVIHPDPLSGEGVKFDTNEVLGGLRALR